MKLTIDLPQDQLEQLTKLGMYLTHGISGEEADARRRCAITLIREGLAAVASLRTEDRPRDLGFLPAFRMHPSNQDHLPPGVYLLGPRRLYSR